MNRYSFSRFLACCLAGLSLGMPAHAFDLYGHNRSTRNAGLYLSFHGDPAPSGIGANLGLTLGEFLQVHGGVGTFSNTISRASDYSVGFVFRALSYPFAWLGYGLGRLLKSGHVDKHLHWGEYMPVTDVREVRSITAYGGGAKLFVPGMNLSPTAGIGWSTYETAGHPDHLPDKGRHIYYTGGFDYVSSGGANFGTGLQFCPDIPGRRWCGFYVNIGGML
jgi:hypothetical protein